jgi:UDP-2,4-diacetamido-2,4,6-trideoxy-beta-L-altropyranose hydrolase
VNHIFVYFGGNDNTNQTSIAIQALKKFPQLNAKVVLGINHPEMISSYAEAHCQANITVVETCPDMAGEMAKADLGLGVCGMAAWERCAMGLPTIVCIIADNQRDDTIALDNLGAVENLGEASKVTSADWTNAISRALNEPSRLARMSEISLNVVEGHKKNLRLLTYHLINYV